MRPDLHCTYDWTVIQAFEVVRTRNFVVFVSYRWLDVLETRSHFPQRLDKRMLVAGALE